MAFPGQLTLSYAGTRPDQLPGRMDPNAGKTWSVRINITDESYARLIAKAGRFEGRIHEFTGSISEVAIWLDEFLNRVINSGVSILSLGTMTLFLALPSSTGHSGYLRIETKNIASDRMKSLLRVFISKHEELVAFGQSLRNI